MEAFEYCFKPDTRADRVKIPAEVAFMVGGGMSPLKAWRKHRAMTQETPADRMGISRPVYAQSERDGVKPRREILRKAAEAMSLDIRQLLELYDDEPLSDDGFVMPPEEGVE